MVYKSGRVSLNPLTLHSCIQLFMYYFILLFSSSPPPDPARPAALQNPRPIRRDLPRCKAPARPAGTSLNLNLILNLILNLNLMSLVYSIIHVFYYSIIPQTPPLDPAGPAALQSPRPTRRNFAQP